MEAVGQLTGGVAHDFNNILTVIIGMTELLSDAVGSDPKLAPIVQAIDEAASRGAQLTQRMLAFARKQPLQARNIDLNEIVTRAATMLQRTIGEDIAVKLALADGLWPALADPSQIEDVILNLAVNARDAMPNGGQLVIETANTHLDEQYAAQNVEVAAGDYVSVVVTDFGHRHAARSGRARVRAVLHHQGGRPRHRAGPEHGVRLREAVARPCEDLQRGRPRHQHQALSAARATAAETATAAEPARADARIRSAARRFWWSRTARRCATWRSRSCARSATGCTRPRTATRRSRSCEQPVTIDLLFTDLIMPNGIDGQELLRRARAVRPGLKALFASGYSEQFLKGRGPARSRRAAAQQALPHAHARRSGAQRARRRNRSLSATASASPRRLARHVVRLAARLVADARMLDRIRACAGRPVCASGCTLFAATGMGARLTSRTFRFVAVVRPRAASRRPPSS